MKSVPTPDDARSYGCVCISRFGEVFVSGNWAKHNLLRYNKPNDKFEEMPLHFTDGAQPVIAGLAMTDDHLGEIWLGTWDGSLISFNPDLETAKLVLTPAESQMQHVHSVLELSRDCLLVGSDKGLAVMDVGPSGRAFTTAAASTQAPSATILYIPS